MFILCYHDIIMLLSTGLRAVVLNLGLVKLASSKLVVWEVCAVNKYCCPHSSFADLLVIRHVCECRLRPQKGHYYRIHYRAVVVGAIAIVIFMSVNGTPT